MEPPKDQGELQERELAKLAPLARDITNIDSAIAEIARFSAELTLPRGTIHVISDIHGEDKKLRHVINNASGTLRPLVEGLLQDRMKIIGPLLDDHRVHFPIWAVAATRLD